MIRISRKPDRPFVAVIAVFLAVSSAFNASASNAAAPSAAHAAAMKTPKLPDPCTLLKPDQANTIVGGTATQKRSETSDEEAQLSCIYRYDNVELNVSIFKTFDKIAESDLADYHAKPVTGLGDRAWIVQPYGIVFEKHHIRYFINYTDRSAKSTASSTANTGSAGGTDPGIDVAKSLAAAKIVASNAP